MPRITMVAGGALLGAFAAVAPAQQVQWQVEGRVGYWRFGSSLAVWQDQDGDGVRDLLVGAPQASDSLEPAAVRIVSGSDLSTLLEVSSGSDAHDGFGLQVADVGDVDADGAADFAVGAPIGKYVRIFSGVDGRQLREWTSPQVTSEFGASLAALGDVDGDGHDDVAIGGPDEASGGRKVGAVRVVSGRNGALLLRITGSTRLARLGDRDRVAALDDLDGDGVRDLALLDVVTIAAVEYGHLRFVSSASGLDLRTLTFDFADYVDFEPVSVAAAGDLDGDGAPDLVVGAVPLDPTQDPGRAFVFSGATAAELLRFDLGTDPTWVIGGAAGDVDGDTLPDLAVAVDDVRFNRNTPSYVVHAGSDGARLLRLVRQAGDHGRELATGADFDGDGVADLAIGNSGEDPYGSGAGVEIHTLPTGVKLAERYETALHELFDGPMAQLGDVNGDGHGDLVAVTQYHEQALIVSGRDGAILARHDVPSVPSHALVALPDLDGDTIGDYAVGAMLPAGSGQVDVISTATGAVLQSFSGPTAGTSPSLFGEAIAAVVQPNGSVHLAIGAPGYSFGIPGAGLVEVFDLGGGKRLFQYPGNWTAEELGSAVTPLHDVDGDGTRDWAFGGPGYNGPGSSAGRVHVVSGVDGAALQMLDGALNELLGAALASTEDLDGDGVGDLLVGAPGFNRSHGEVRALSGAGFGRLWVRGGVANGDRFGRRIDVVADTNGDGLADWRALGGRPDRVEWHSGNGDLLTRFEHDNLLAVARPPWGAPVSPSGDRLPDLVVALHGEETWLRLTAIGDLPLQIDPPRAFPGDTVTASTRGAPAGNLAALMLVEINGVPTASLIELGAFGADGEFHVVDSVPAGLTGTAWTLRSYAIGWDGKVATSFDQRLEFH